MILLPRQYATMFLTKPWDNIRYNENPHWYWYNTENVIRNTVEYIINTTSIIQQPNGTQQSNSTALNITMMIPTVRVERTYGYCFIACHIGIDPYSTVPLYKYYYWPFNTKWYLRSSFKLNYTQPGISWSKCRSISQGRKKPYRGTLHSFAAGVTGFKYSSEYRVAYNNSVKLRRTDSC